MRDSSGAQSRASNRRRGCASLRNRHAHARRGSEIGTIADQRVDAPIEEPSHVRGIVDGPDLDREPDAVRVRDEMARDDASRARSLRDLKLPIGFLSERPADPGSIERESYLFPRRAGRDARLELSSPSRRTRHPNDPSATRSARRAARTSWIVRRASSGSFTFSSMISGTPGYRDRTCCSRGMPWPCPRYGKGRRSPLGLRACPPGVNQ